MSPLSPKMPKMPNMSDGWRLASTFLMTAVSGALLCVDKSYLLDLVPEEVSITLPFGTIMSAFKYMCAACTLCYIAVGSAYVLGFLGHSG
mmetsp:Transcript_9657/g.14469  ORF Transcript_9657/g.14469 Transcript_9657/m.14469 type:complete len:90 (+) Transcript_9657:57-326(+)